MDHEDGYEEAELAANSTQDDVAVPYSSTLPDARECDSLAKTREAIEQVQVRQARLNAHYDAYKGDCMIFGRFSSSHKGIHCYV